jgi:heme oxygenase
MNRTDTQPNGKLVAPVDYSEFLRKLRAETAPMHEILEQNRLSQAIVAENITLNEYIIYLKLFYGFVKPFEDKVYGSLGHIITDAASRRRSGALALDLAYFGMEADAIDALPLYDIAGSLHSDAIRMGGMYVLEGSTLGGQVITRHLNKALGLQGPDGVRFFSGHGKNTGPVWKNFVEMFAGFAVGSHKEDEVIAGAQIVFKGFSTWLNKD